MVYFPTNTMQAIEMNHTIIKEKQLNIRVVAFTSLATMPVKASICSSYSRPSIPLAVNHGNYMAHFYSSAPSLEAKLVFLWRLERFNA
jgi:hypothetical protein